MATLRYGFLSYICIMRIPAMLKVLDVARLYSLRREDSIDISSHKSFAERSISASSPKIRAFHCLALGP